jgi:amino acid adenylation domain-containing protein
MYELTAMQAACWVSRHAKGESEAETSAHLYVELDSVEHQTPLDPARLSRAVLALFKRHVHLRLAVDTHGIPTIAELSTEHRLRHNDLRGLAPATCDETLARIRVSKTHQRLSLESGEACEFTLSQLPDGRHRLHIDLDMIAADPSCFPYVMADLAQLYEADATLLSPTAGNFVKYLEARRTDPTRSDREAAARQWWQNQIPNFPQAPSLLAPTTIPCDNAAQSTRLAAQLSITETNTFMSHARALRVTPSALALAVFAQELGQACKQTAFRLTVPMFHRPGITDRGTLIGDFSNFTLFSIDQADADIDILAPCVQTQLVQAVSHAARSGPQLMRDLGRHLGALPNAPVVFTAGFDHPLGSILPENANKIFGDLVWSVSQGPGVALDAQIAKLGDRILVNWDIRLDLVDGKWVEELFDRFVARLRALSTQAENKVNSQPLSQLQRAYIMGRDRVLPLGGIAMQEVRLFRGTLDTGQLRTRLDALCDAHPALRTRIDEDDLRLRYLIKASTPLDLKDFSTAQNASEKLADFWEAFAQSACALDGPLWNVCAIKMPAGLDDALAVKFDALALDGPAIAQICAEIFAPTPPDNEPSPIRVMSASAAQRRADAAYWAEALNVVETGTNLPWLTPLQQISTSRYRRETRCVDAAQRRGLRRAAAKDKLFLNSLLSFVVLEVLVRFTPEMHLCVGLPTAPALEQTGLGNRASFIVVDHDARIGTPHERAAALQTKTMNGLSHMGFSGVDLARQLLSQTRESLALPVVLTNGLSWVSPDPAASMHEAAGQTQTPQVALDIRLMNAADGGIEIAADYAEAALSTDTVNAILNAVTAAFSNICEHQSLDLPKPLVPVSTPLQHPNISDPAPYLLKIATNLRKSQGVALIQGTTQVSYAELRIRVAAILAGFAEHGVDAGAVLAIHLPRGFDHIALQLAASLAGVIWVPLDASAPTERRDYQLARCAPTLVVSNDDICDWPCIDPTGLMASGGGALPGDAVLAERSLSRDASYYLFTSGTTGAPKCVVLNNRATTNVLDQSLNAWAVVSKDIIMSATPLHHDMSLFDIFGALSAGATLVMPDIGQDKDAIEWAQIIARHNVTHWVSVPAILEMLLDCAQPAQLRSLRLIAQGGDYIKPAQIARLRELRPDARLFSLGGPTETTIWSIWHEIGSETGAVPYGRALNGAEYLICNPVGELCPPGVVGRIHTAGDCLSLGYLDDGKLASTDFVALPDENGNPRRAFRTGDLGQWTPDGTILFAGRVGGYVKVRGVRVSLGEIEAVLSNHSGLRQSIIVDLASDDGRETTLAALCVCHEDSQPSMAELRSYMREKLPQSHLPDRFILVLALPLSANGKIDRTAARCLATRPPNVAPATKAVEPDQQLAIQVLGIYLEHIGMRDDANADSILLNFGLMPNHLAPIATTLNERLGCKLSPMQLLGARTARQAAALIAQQPALSAT